jgi:hypothetical protein
VSNILRAAQEPVPIFPTRDPTSFFQFDSQLLDLHYTEPPTGGHAIWFPVYGYEPMYDWMFARSSVPEPSSIGLGIVAFLFAVMAFRGSAFRRARTAC